MFARVMALVVLVAIGLAIGYALQLGWGSVGPAPVWEGTVVAGGDAMRASPGGTVDLPAPLADRGNTDQGTRTVEGGSAVAVTPEFGGGPEAATAPTPSDGGPPPSPTPTSRRIGIIPGHWQYDSGAVCADGRREVDVTTDVALRVQAILEVRGYEVDLLPEHDPDVPQPPMQNYRASAVVSVHADSCDFAGVSGFKVARWAYSAMPAVEDDLVDCLNREYEASTLLSRHEDTITADMWNYYAFRELAETTPAAIIELGFLADDRDSLDRLRYEMALGIANGLSCFLDGP